MTETTRKRSIEERLERRLEEHETIYGCRPEVMYLSKQEFDDYMLALLPTKRMSNVVALADIEGMGFHRVEFSGIQVLLAMDRKLYDHEGFFEEHCRRFTQTTLPAASEAYWKAFCPWKARLWRLRERLVRRGILRWKQPPWDLR